MSATDLDEAEYDPDRNYNSSKKLAIHRNTFSTGQPLAHDLDRNFGKVADAKSNENGESPVEGISEKGKSKTTCSSFPQFHTTSNHKLESPASYNKIDLKDSESHESNISNGKSHLEAISDSQLYHRKVDRKSRSTRSEEPVLERRLTKYFYKFQRISSTFEYAVGRLFHNEPESVNRLRDTWADFLDDVRDLNLKLKDTTAKPSKEEVRDDTTVKQRQVEAKDNTVKPRKVEAKYKKHNKKKPTTEKTKKCTSDQIQKEPSFGKRKTHVQNFSRPQYSSQCPSLPDLKLAERSVTKSPTKLQKKKRGGKKEMSLQEMLEVFQNHKKKGPNARRRGPEPE